MSDSNLPAVMVLDGAQRAALAVTRSIGSRGVRVIVADAEARTLASTSKFCHGRVAVGCPWRSASEFAGRVNEMATELDCGLIMALTDASLTALGAVGEGLAGSLVAAPPRQAYETASNKAAAAALARKAGLRVPEGIECGEPADVRRAVAAVGYPAVVKPVLSRYLADDRIHAANVIVVHGPQDLEQCLRLPWVSLIPCLVQRFVPGHGAGIFTLFSDAGPVAWFAHRRLREKPPGGGVSVLSESAPVDPGLREHAHRFLAELDWSGPAMVEFRVDPEGIPWFMEVNARFWGSLQLAIDSGIDFPWLYYGLRAGHDPMSPKTYRTGRRLRWLLGDFDRLLLQLRGKGTARTASDRLRSLLAFLNPLAGRPEILRPGDPGPFFFELRRWLADVAGSRQ